MVFPTTARLFLIWFAAFSASVRVDHLGEFQVALQDGELVEEIVPGDTGHELEFLVCLGKIPFDPFPGIVLDLEVLVRTLEFLDHLLELFVEG